MINEKLSHGKIDGCDFIWISYFFSRIIIILMEKL